MIAVPSWSSWKTGTRMVSLSVCSMRKHSGARMSSRLMPPTVGSSNWQKRMTSWGSSVSISMSKTSIPANFLKRTPLPSITGLAANAPMFPSPSTAVPLDTTATRFPRAV